MQGHTSTIEDVAFKPGSATQLASVGDDKRLLLWDTRTGTQPVTKMGAAHGEYDIHTVDWCRLRDHHIATGDNRQSAMGSDSKRSQGATISWRTGSSRTVQFIGHVSG